MNGYHVNYPDDFWFKYAERWPSAKEVDYRDSTRSCLIFIQLRSRFANTLNKYVLKVRFFGNYGEEHVRKNKIMVEV